MKKINEAAYLKPWVMKEEVVNVMREILDRHLRGEKLPEGEVVQITAGKSTPPDYEVINGTARIPVYGIISKRASLIQRISSPGTSTLEIERDLKAALEDPQVRDIVLDIDSPGGGVDGVLELSDMIYACRGKKKIVAYANGDMCSAAYWIGSAAEKIYASRGSDVGSIGVYSAVYDYSVANHNAGVKTEVIKAGKNKAAGHPDKPLTPEDRQVIQKRIDHIYDLFVEAVARNRGISADDVLEVATGDVFIGQEALDVGLVDGICTFDSLFSGQLAGNAAAGKKTTAVADGQGSKGLNIDKTAENAEKHNQEEAMFDVKTATPDQLKAENKGLADALIAEGKATGAAEAKAAELKRTENILANTPKGMESLALEAIKSGASVEEAQKSFLKALQGSGAPDVGAGEGDAAFKNKAQKIVKTHLEMAKEYAAEHKCTMTTALSATAAAYKEQLPPPAKK